MERRLSKKDLMELYGVDRVTIEDWRVKSTDSNNNSSYSITYSFRVD